ncbi:F-box protein PP2-A13-like [Malania oleifera]|uniref:F-box protein PP2-A13-like n=1 Tax=Malania oleifera TaxID=397392 RepID=UPI0025AE4E08|nr:F-box protein PP2-A13-like [Malania oleifera]
MGAGLSGGHAVLAGDGEEKRRAESGLGDIPESCIASVLMHLDPPEICGVARLSRTFGEAASADCVWESKLPSNYEVLLQRVLAMDQLETTTAESLGKKEIYKRLSRPNRFDGGAKEVWLDKRSGRICIAISWKALRITGIDDRRYWNHLPSQESRFHTIAYLQQMWWLEVDGELEFGFPTGSYSVYFRLHLGKASRRLGRRVCNLENVHGWDIKPVRFQLLTSTGHHAISQCYLQDPGNWVHHHVGDFVVENPNTLTKIQFSMTQIDCTHTKGGLCVDSVLVYPTEYSLKDG